MSLKLFSTKFLDDLVVLAKRSPRMRQHSNVHTGYDDPCQRLFNAIEPNSYICPHQHNSPETLFAIRGTMALIFFNDVGLIDRVEQFGVESVGSKGNVVIGVEIPPGKWHSVLSFKSGSILLEIKAGPFDPDRPKILAPWAPREGSSESIDFLKNLKESLAIT